VYSDPTTISPSSEAAHILDNTTPLVVHADPSTAPQEEHAATGDVCTMPDKVRKYTRTIYPYICLIPSPI